MILCLHNFFLYNYDIYCPKDSKKEKKSNVKNHCTKNSL